MWVPEPAPGGELGDIVVLQHPRGLARLASVPIGVAVGAPQGGETVHEDTDTRGPVIATNNLMLGVFSHTYPVCILNETLSDAQLVALVRYFLKVVAVLPKVNRN